MDDPGKRPTLNRDLVLWDQRGTYFSQPRLRCREGNALPPDADDKAQREAFRRCGERLTREAGDLSAFNSLENARDVDDVRAALGLREPSISTASPTGPNWASSSCVNGPRVCVLWCWTRWCRWGSAW